MNTFPVMKKMVKLIRWNIQTMKTTFYSVISVTKVSETKKLFEGILKEAIGLRNLLKMKSYNLHLVMNNSIIQCRL